MISHYIVSRAKSNRYRDADAAPSKALCIVYYEKGNDKQALYGFLDMCLDDTKNNRQVLTSE